MTTRNFDALFAPRAIALIGASNEPGAVGAVLARNLLEGGFAGPVMPVNPHAGAIRSALTFADIASLPIVPDLAVVATPAASVPEVIAALGARGCRAAVVISAGVSGALRQEMLDAARPHLLRIVGPNCLGFLSPRRGINASFAANAPQAGRLALVAQSGAIAAAALDWAMGRGLGFSHIITIGDAADVDVGDLLDYLALDDETDAILLYIEGVADGRKFMSAGRIAARSKPVIVVKAGRSAAGAQAAFSHTGALAGADAVYDAAIRRAGMLRVGDLRELFDAAATLTGGFNPLGDRLAIVTNGGGAGVLAADALDQAGGHLPPISEAGQARLAAVLPASAARGNPIDILGDAGPDRYRQALGIAGDEAGVDAILALNCPTALTDGVEAARVVVQAALVEGGKPVFACWLGDRAAAPGRAILTAAGVPSHETPEESVRAFMHLVRHRQNQQAMMQTPSPPPVPPQRDAARRLVEAALKDGRDRLTDPEARALLAAYGIAAVDSEVAATPEAAGEAAARLGGPIALKILSRQISHKTDVGGVALNLSGAAAVAEAAARMLEAVGRAAPQAAVDGFIVERMVVRPRAEELIVGLAVDPVFGPTVLFGRGGVAVEIDPDRSIGLAPLDDVLARDLIARTHVAARLAGYRDRKPVHIDAVAAVLVRLSNLALDLPQVSELDINPLLADADGVLALDARVRLTAAAAARPAICAYPAHLERQVEVEGSLLTVRPVRPQDEPDLLRLVEALPPEALKLTLGRGPYSPEQAARRLSQIDYDRQMVLVAASGGALLGLARLVADPEGTMGEIALAVQSDQQGRHLARRLLESLIDYARARGMARLWGDMEQSSSSMSGLTEALGFERSAPSDGRVRITLDLGGEAKLAR